MSYFKNFPTVSLDVFDNNTEVLLTDITRRVRFSDLARKIMYSMITMISKTKKPQNTLQVNFMVTLSYTG